MAIVFTAWEINWGRVKRKAQEALAKRSILMTPMTIYWKFGLMLIISRRRCAGFN